MSQTAVSNYYQSQVTQVLKEKSITFYIGLITVLLIAGTFYIVLTQQKPSASMAKKIDNTYMAPKPRTVEPKTYIVQETDSLSSIALAQLGDGDKWVDIAKINNITDPNTVVAGMKLIMPTGAIVPSPIAMVSAVPTETPVPSVTQMPSPTTIPTPVVASQGDIGDTGAMTKKANPKIKEYIVLEGEGLWEIAEKVYGDGQMFTEIMKANNIQDPNMIVPGMKLKMPKFK